MLSAIKAAWIFYSLLITAVLFVLFTVPGVYIINKTPTCPSISIHQTECIACGMTRGFTAIAEGRLEQARSFNRYSIAVFSIFLTNTAIFIVFGITKIQLNRRNFLKIKRNKSWLKQV